MNPSIKDRIKREIKEWAEALVIAGISGLVITTFFIQAFKIPSGSMVPTFNIGDRLFVDKFLYSARVPFVNWRIPFPSARQPKRGDIIVFVSTEERSKDLIKRLIALGGETVEIKEGKIYINGKALDGPSSIRSVYYYNAGEYGKEGRAVTVPQDSYYVLGDNSANSRDSRYWGFVPKKNLIGRALIRHWPINRIKVFK